MTCDLFPSNMMTSMTPPNHDEAPTTATGQSIFHRATFLDELVAMVPVECFAFGKWVFEVTAAEGRLSS